MSIRYMVFATAFALGFVWLGHYLERGGNIALAVGATGEEHQYEVDYGDWLSNESNLAAARTLVNSIINDINNSQEQEKTGRLGNQDDESHRVGNFESHIINDWSEYGTRTTGDLGNYDDHLTLSTDLIFEIVCEDEGQGGPENTHHGESAEGAQPWIESNAHLGEWPHEAEPGLNAVEAIR